MMVSAYNIDIELKREKNIQESLYATFSCLKRP